MELNQINQLMLAMRRTGTKKLHIKKGDVEVTLERDDRPASRLPDSLVESFEENPMRSDFEKHKATHAVEVSKPAAAIAKEDPLSVYITSPMVGTFYHSPSPNDPPFVKVGDRVEKNTVVCIVEAMKVMNEVKAQIAGTVAEVAVENGSPIEFGSRLFRIVP